MKTVREWKVRSAALGAALAALVALVPADAAAQACLRPAGSHANWLAVGSGVAEGSHTAATVELGRSFRPNLALFAEGDAVIWNDGGELQPSRRSGRVVGLFRVVQAKSAGICLTGAAEYVQVGDLKILMLPVGLPLSTQWKLGGTWRVVPHVEPRVAYRHASLLSFTETKAAASVRAGLALGNDRYFGGLTLNQPITSGDAWTVRLRLGLEF
jgi:hypothetical protein